MGIPKMSLGWRLPDPWSKLSFYSWDYLDLGQVIVRAWDIPGYPGISQDVPGYSCDYLDLGKVIARAWDILGYPGISKMSQGILGTTWT